MKSLLTTALALLVIAGPAAAQGPIAVSTGDASSVTADDPPRVPAVLVRALDSRSADDRADAMHRMLTLAVDSPRGIDLGPATAKLLFIFEADSDVRHRIMALRCLEASQSEDAMADLRADANEETDPAVKRLLFSVLLDHYGADELRRDARVVELARSIQTDLQG